VHLQVRIIAALLLLGVLAIGTGTVLLVGYLFAAVAMGVIMFIKTRRMIKRIADARRATGRLSPPSGAATIAGSNDHPRLAA
jgi:hypothetical protein